MSIRLKDTIYDLINNADKIDNLDSTSLFRKLGTNVDINTFADDSNKNGIIYINTTTPADINAPFSYGTILSLNSSAGSWMLGNSSSGVLKFRNRWWSGNGAVWGDWKDIAFKTDIPTIPIALKNPKALTIQNNGTTVDSYDGSAAKTINITHPTIPTALKCPTSLTIQLNGTSQGAWDGSTAKTINITPAAIGAAASDHTHSGYLPRLRMTNPDPGHASIGAIPYIFALKAAGTPVYGDPEFKDGNNGVGYYNNSGGGTVTVTRISDNQNSANSSGYILQISTSTGTASPGRGGFVQNITSRAGAVFCQIFRAKIPTGFTVENAENNMGDGYRTYWLTDRAGTGKWEWYCRITICGLSGNMHGGGHVYLSGSGAVTWYLSYCNLIDLTKGNYDGLRSLYAGKLDSSAGSATNPVYFSGGVPVACTYSLNKTVPSDAKFTDTTYSTATSSTLGLVKIGYAQSGKNYPVQLSNGQMYVNVPWTDTNTDTNTWRGITDSYSGTDSTISLSQKGGKALYDALVNGYASSAGTATSLYTGSASGTSHANALQTYFNSNKSSIPRNKTISFYSSAYSNGSQYTGYFLSGYDSTPYGGFFCAHYDNCYYVGISYGTFNEQRILTSSNWSSYCAAASHTHSYAASSHTHTKSQITDFSHTHDYAASNHSHSGYMTTSSPTGSGTLMMNGSNSRGSFPAVKWHIGNVNWAQLIMNGSGELELRGGASQDAGYATLRTGAMVCTSLYVGGEQITFTT